jgi:uncharacterized membrane protein
MLSVTTYAAARPTARRLKGEADMMFFALVAIVGLVAAGLGWLGVPVFDEIPEAMRWGLALPLILAGLDHLRNPGRYLAMMPDFVPQPGFFVAFTGVAEIAGAVGIVVPWTQWLAGMMLAIYFVAVFPANIKVALTGGRVEGMPDSRVYYWARLAFQPLVVWWSLFAAEVTPWPFI